MANLPVCPGICANRPGFRAHSAGRRAAALTAVLSCALLLSALPAPDEGGGGGGGSKSGYNLLNPTPMSAKRALASDRPTVTNSPITVDAGHFQIEVGALDISHDTNRGLTTNLIKFADTALKVGLTNELDLQMLFTFHTWAEYHRSGGGTFHRDGFSDITFRVKFNVWGNDGSSRGDALGVMPYLKLATNEPFSNDHTEGGAMVMYQRELDRDWQLGAMGSIDALYDPADDNYDLGLGHSVVVRRTLNRQAVVFLEYAGLLNSDPDYDYQARLIAGGTFLLDKDLMFDAGLRIGLTRVTEDFALFGGLTWRY